MLVGSIMLTACAGSDPQFLAIFLTALFVLGAGAWASIETGDPVAYGSVA